MVLTLIAAAAISASCAWDNPRGTHAVTDVRPSTLVDNYTDIPKATRDRIKARMDALKFDDVAEIRKDSIKGAWAYSGLRDMHFGAAGGKVCRAVSLANWKPEEVERALIYCEDGHCIAAPTVCRNVSRITRGPRLALPPTPLALDIPPAEVDALPVAVLAPIPEIEPGPLSDDYTPQTFLRLSVPDVPQTVPQDRYERISADLTFWDGWARPILWGGLGIVQRVTVPSSPIVVSLPPVPGVVPVIVGDKPVTVPALPTKPVDVPDDAPDAVAPVPEPGTWGLMLGGLLGVWVMVRRRAAR